VLTSNRSRDLSDALRRRCLYHWIDYPSLEKELAIVTARVPAISETLSRQVAEIMQTTRTMSLSKVPGVAETLDWATALVALNAAKVDGEVLNETIGCFLKDEADIAAFKAQLDLNHG
jgi:MoxR-like ATPase